MPLTKTSQSMLSTLVPDVVGGYLSLSSSMLDFDNTVSSTTVYFIPIVNDLIRLWDGYRYGLYSIGSSGINTNFTVAANTRAEVFCFLFNGVPTLSVETGVTLTRSFGVVVKSGDLTKRHLGSIWIGGTPNTAIWRPKTDFVSAFPILGVLNRYNRRTLVATGYDSTDSWTYGTASWRTTNGIWSIYTLTDALDTIGVEAYSMLKIDPVARTYRTAISSQASALDGTGYSTVTDEGDSNGSAPSNGRHTPQARYERSFAPAAGLITIYGLEYAVSGTTTVYGDNGGVSQSLMRLKIQG